jgi:hypothetical protein
MRTIRQQVFETNSSSEHCIAFVDAKRKPEEFPVVPDNGVLEIEVKHFWECGGTGVITNKVVDIIEYLYCIAMGCVACNRPESMEQFLTDLKNAYQAYGLIPPTSVYGYFLDDKDNRHPYEDLVYDRIDYVMEYSPAFVECYFNSLDGYHGMSRKEFDEFCRLHRGYVDEKVIRPKQRVGISSNLFYEDYNYSTEITEKDPVDDTYYTGYDLLVTPSTLYFYHS